MCFRHRPPGLPELDAEALDQHQAALPRKKRGEIRKLPVILPIVLHHGQGGWTAALCFEEMLDADEELLALLGEHVPRLRLILDDLGQQSDEQIYARGATAFARLVLWALKNARDAGWLKGELRVWKGLIAAVLAEKDGMRALTALFRYIVQTNPTVKREVLRGLLPGDRGRQVEEAVMNWLEQEVDLGEVAVLLRLATDRLLVPQQDGMGDPLVHDLPRGADHLARLALGQCLHLGFRREGMQCSELRVIGVGDHDQSRRLPARQVARGGLRFGQAELPDQRGGARIGSTGMRCGKPGEQRKAGKTSGKARHRVSSRRVGCAAYRVARCIGRAAALARARNSLR